MRNKFFFGVLSGIWMSGVLVFSSLGAASILLSMQAGCKKAEEPSPREYSVTLTYYSQSPKFAIRYIDSGVLHTDTISAKAFSKSVKVAESDFYFEPSIESLIPASSDSVYIRADIDGKKVEKGFRSYGSTILISVWLQAAK